MPALRLEDERLLTQTDLLLLLLLLWDCLVAARAAHVRGHRVFPSDRQRVLPVTSGYISGKLLRRLYHVVG